MVNYPHIFMRWLTTAMGSASILQTVLDGQISALFLVFALLFLAMTFIPPNNTGRFEPEFVDVMEIRNRLDKDVDKTKIIEQLLMDIWTAQAYDAFTLGVLGFVVSYLIDIYISDVVIFDDETITTKKKIQEFLHSINT